MILWKWQCGFMVTAVASDPPEVVPASIDHHFGTLSCRWLPGIQNFLGAQVVRYRLSQSVSPSPVDGIQERDMPSYSKPRCFVRRDRAFFISSLRNDPRDDHSWLDPRDQIWSRNCNRWQKRLDGVRLDRCGKYETGVAIEAALTQVSLPPLQLPATLRGGLQLISSRMWHQRAIQTIL